MPEAFEIEIPASPRGSMSSYEAPGPNSGNSEPPKKEHAFLMKARGIAIVIGAIGTAAAAFWGAVRKPEEKIAIAGYEAMAKIVKDQGDEITKLHDDLISLHSYLQAIQDLRKEKPEAGIPALGVPPTARPATRKRLVASPTVSIPDVPAPGPKPSMDSPPDVGALILAN